MLEFGLIRFEYGFVFLRFLYQFWVNMLEEFQGVYNVLNTLLFTKIGIKSLTMIHFFLFESSFQVPMSGKDIANIKSSNPFR